MLYPKKINAKKGKKISKISVLVTATIAILLLFINYIYTPQSRWSIIAILGILYTGVTVSYSLKKGINIAGHVLLQMVAISLLTILIDNVIGYKGWSISIALPISMITANISMLILTIMNRKKYLSYVVYQISILIISMLPLLFLTEHMVKSRTLSIISIVISLLNFFVCILLCRKDLKEELQRRMHV